MKTPDYIDIVQLYVHGDVVKWNKFLSRLLRDRDMNGCAHTIYKLKLGMSEATKKKLNDEKICTLYLRLIRSLELTAKKILARRHPLPGDSVTHHLRKDPGWLAKKRARDREWAAFLKKSGY